MVSAQPVAKRGRYLVKVWVANAKLPIVSYTSDEDRLFPNRVICSFEHLKAGHHLRRPFSMFERRSAENRQKELAEARKELLRLIVKSEAHRKTKRFGELAASQASS